MKISSLGSPNTKLKTERLTLKPLELSDIDRVTALANNEEISKMTARMPFPYVRKDARDFIIYVGKAMMTGKEIAFGIRLTETDEIIGVCGVNVESGSPELGYWLGEEYWGQGYCTEAAEAVVDYVRKLDRFSQIMAQAKVDNKASNKIIEKLGFKFGTETSVSTKYNPDPVRMYRHYLELEA